MRIVQLCSPSGDTRVAMVEGDKLRLLDGTESVYALAQAALREFRPLAQTIAAQMRGCVRRVGYSQAVRLRRSFVAFMNRPGVGGHALCVLEVDETKVQVIDPLSGTRETMARQEFEAEWDPVIVWVEKPGR